MVLLLTQLTNSGRALFAVGEEKGRARRGKRVKGSRTCRGEEERCWLQRRRGGFRNVWGAEFRINNVRVALIEQGQTPRGAFDSCAAFEKGDIFQCCFFFVFSGVALRRAT